jgi:SET domain-containing protein
MAQLTRDGKKLADTGTEHVQTASRVRLINPPVSGYRLEICPSRIAGWGVFAREVIPRGRQVIEYAGDRITFAEARRRWRVRGRPKRITPVRLNRHWVIDPWNGNSSVYINHSCEPNLYRCRPRGHLLLFSLKRIRPGEELTFDYKLNPVKPWIACRCGSPRCRGVMDRHARKPRPRKRLH